MGKATIVKRSGERLNWNEEIQIGINSDMNCCALSELHGIQAVDDPFTTLVNLVVIQENEPFNSAVLFTAAGDHQAGVKLTQYILEKGLGSIQICDKFRNANTGRQIQLFVWVVNVKAWEAFAKRIITLVDNMHD